MTQPDYQPLSHDDWARLVNDNPKDCIHGLHRAGWDAAMAAMRKPEPVAEVKGKPVDWTRPIQLTGVNYPCRFLTLLAHKGDKVHNLVAITNTLGNETVYSFDQNGWLIGASGMRIENIPDEPKRIKRTVWLNIYNYQIGCKMGASTKEEADQWSENHRNDGSTGRIACMKIDIDVPEGTGL